MTGFNTKLIHGQNINDNQTGAVNVPVYTSSTYAYPDINGKVRWDYSRSGNPTREYLEKQIAQLEHGTNGFAFASGMAAIHAAFSIFKDGDHVLIGDQIYGGTYRLINDYFQSRGLTFTSVNTQNLEEVEAAIQPNTKAIYFEPVTNPLLHVTSVRAIAEIAKKHDILTIVDNTFLTPYLQQPLDLGADIVVHSATKYLGGHSDVIAGLVVTKNEELGKQIYFIQNALGGVLSPENANLVRRGIQTLSVRMDRQQENACKLIDFLNSREEVATIHYPGVEGSHDHEVAAEECDGFGGVFSFELADDVDATEFVNSLQLIRLAVSLGAVESLAELPYEMSHAELPVAERLAAGITPQLIRISVGIEDAEDLIGDLKQALASATRRQNIHVLKRSLA
ncbi:PLP-dependent aspartate aminotransferase family protein [Paucilactobacillus suebicus]|uniref:Cystathionine beta-lyase n=1 Tax=Paucilactobacillus suebicus DSM 5007 = KCTC 3549 TaxID=1423807 RepID=A0A0R1VY00_9LACO|nr:PLP-dependent aspartate aminotransferase family protein [Paucilactobacillus suebicus]KRM10306.1 cystathionine beta-lyase [Paucilactobacillus suebicus DSM 5007 = KCTC 3549]